MVTFRQYAASGQPLGASDSCLAHLDYQFQRSDRRVARHITNSRKQRAIGALREQAIRCRHRYLLRVRRGEGRAVGAAEAHDILDIDLKIEIIVVMAKTSLGTML